MAVIFLATWQYLPSLSACCPLYAPRVVREWLGEAQAAQASPAAQVEVQVWWAVLPLDLLRHCRDGFGCATDLHCPARLKQAPSVFL